MAVHADRMLVDRSGQGGERLEVGQCRLPVALVVLAEGQQLPRRGGVGNGVDHRLEDPRCVPVPLALEGADTGGHALGDPVPEMVPVGTGGRGQLVGDVRRELGRGRHGAVGRWSQFLGTGGLPATWAVGPHPPFGHELVGAGTRPSALLGSVPVLTRVTGSTPHRARSPTGDAPPPLADHRRPGDPLLGSALRLPPPSRGPCAGPPVAGLLASPGRPLRAALPLAGPRASLPTGPRASLPTGPRASPGRPLRASLPTGLRASPGRPLSASLPTGPRASLPTGLRASLPTGPRPAAGVGPAGARAGRPVRTPRSARPPRSLLLTRPLRPWRPARGR